MDEEHVHHETDHFAGREVIAGRLVRQLVEAADEVLEDEPHLLVGDVRWVKIDASDFRDHEVEDIRLLLASAVLAARDRAASQRSNSVHVMRHWPRILKAAISPAWAIV